MTRQSGGRIEEIAAESPAERFGLRPGDRLLSINARSMTDILVYQDALAEDEQRWVLQRGARSLEIDFGGPFEEDPGVTFADDLFDGVRRCGNRCCFCFVDQLPPGLRSTLYVKDEDYRLSFLHGSYLTLSRLSSEELDTIDELRLSPLYVSVHATEPDVRARLLGREGLPPILEQLRSFSERDIDFWAQIVVVPGMNDGPILSRSLEELQGLRPSCLGVGVVPVGLTGHRKGLPALRPITKEEAEDVLRRVRKVQRENRNCEESRFAWAADEFYRIAERPVPGWASYEGFPLLEDGIGMLRRFRDRLARALQRRPAPRSPLPRSAVATSQAAHPLFLWACERLERAGWPVPEVRQVENHFFSDTVTVAGLLTGRDLARAFRGATKLDQILVSAHALRDGAHCFLDDESPESVARQIGVPIVTVEDDALAFLDALTAYPGTSDAR